MGNNKILIDSSFLIAFLNPNDALTGKAAAIMKDNYQKEVALILHPLVIIETLTVLKMKISTSDMKKIENLLFSEAFDTIKDFEFDWQKGSAWLNFFDGNNKLSAVDCILLSYAIKHKIRLLSFDKKLNQEYKRNFLR